MAYFEPLTLLSAMSAFTSHVVLVATANTSYTEPYNLVRCFGSLDPPQELSGGQRQQLAIVRALAMTPAVIVADDPLSDADVSVRGQVLNLLLDLKRTRNVSCLMITHEVAVARSFADQVAVTIGGELVEQEPAASVLSTPSHPYTRRLLESARRPGA